MILKIAMQIVDYDPMTVAQRSIDTRRYTQLVWSRSHPEPIDEEQLCLFLTDEHYGDLTEEQKSVARTCRDQIRAVYGAMVLRLLQFDEMMRRGMISDFYTFRDMFIPKVAEKEEAIHHTSATRQDDAIPSDLRGFSAEDKCGTNATRKTDLGRF